MSLSSDILPEFREYDRTITTVMNDYVRPIMTRYLTRIEDRLAKDGVKAHLHIVRSDGGLMSARAAAERPVHTVLSGPAGGVTSTVMVARRTGLDLLAFDMGGTSTDVSVIIDGQPAISRATEVGMFPAKVPTLDVRSVGAGGGSIAEVNDLTRSLRVGRAARGRGRGRSAIRAGNGTHGVGRQCGAGLSAARSAGGDMSLDCAGGADGGGRHRAAAGPVVRGRGAGHLADRQRGDAGALRVITVQRGLDPRDFRHPGLWRCGAVACERAGRAFGLLSGGRAAQSGVLSALGFLEAEFKNEFVQTFIRSSRAMDPALVWDRFRDLAGRAGPGWTSRRWRKRTGVWSIRWTCGTNSRGMRCRWTSTRHRGRGGALTPVFDTFHGLHERMYGVRFHVPSNSSRCAWWPSGPRPRWTRRR